MSEPDVTVRVWAENTCATFVTVKLSAQSAADIRGVLCYCLNDPLARCPDQSAFHELLRQLQALTLPEPTLT